MTGSSSTRLIVLRGNSGSGKSALAAAIRGARPRGVAIVGLDHVRRELLHVPDEPGALSVEFVDLAARFALDRGLHVVVEGILHEEIYGDVLRLLVAEHRGASRCYRYDLTFEETLRRHLSKGGRIVEEVDEATLRSWWRPADPLPGVDERVLPAGSSLEDSLRTVLRDCGWDEPIVHATG